MTFPLPALFFFDGSYWNRVWKRKGEGEGKGGLDPAFLLLFHEKHASRYFFIAFPNSSFVSKSNNNNNRKKISRICLIRTCRMISQIPNIQEKNPLSRLNFQNFGEICFLGRCKIPWRDRAITCEFCRDLHLTLMFSSLYKKIRLMESELWRNVISNKIIFTLGLQGLPSSFLSRPGAYVH